jgi:hypothetical protein
LLFEKDVRILRNVKTAWLLPILLIACGPSTPIGDPAGSNNFDDPDDPGNSGQNSGGPDASGDANGRFCTAPRDCPAAFVCAYPITDACGASGRCLPYDTNSCGNAPFACGCTNTPVQLCAPTGYAPKPVVSGSPCDGSAPPQDASQDVSSQDVTAQDALTE